MKKDKLLPTAYNPAYTKCRDCTGKCCRYILVDIPTPRSRLDYNNYGWYLAHERTAIYIDDGKWYLAVMAYNCGEGRIADAIQKAGSDDLSILIDDGAKYLPSETREYNRQSGCIL